MGKRAQEKRATKVSDGLKSRSIISRVLVWTQKKHPHLWIAILAFLLVASYPFAIQSKWYKKNINNLSGEALMVEIANEAEITTDKGNIIFRFERGDAPKTTENFIRLASKKYFDGLTFHRVEEGFVIQGGDPKGDGTGGESAWGGQFEDEINPLSPLYQDAYREGTVAMANSGPNTNGSQFFIMLADRTDLPKNYTIFGKVTSGMDTVKKITKGDKMVKVEVR